VVPALGGYERKISSFGYRPRWSPDGSRILFSGSLQETLAEPQRVYVVSLGGNPPRQVLTELHKEHRFLSLFAWHPDGRRVLYWTHHDEPGWGLCMVPLGGGKRVKSDLTTDMEKQFKAAGFEPGFLADFLLGPSGDALYFQGKARGVWNLWRVTLDPETLRVVAGPERLTTGSGPDTDMALSPTGKKLAFTMRKETTRIWSVPFDANRGQIRGKGEPVTAAGRDAFQPDLSRDGKELVFLTYRAGMQELRRRSLEDGRETLLAADNFLRFTPCWSRDGKFLAYHRRNSVTGENSIVVMPKRGGDEVILTSPTSHEGRGFPWDWSLDSEWILGNSRHLPPRKSVIWLLPLSSAPHAETRARIVASDPEHDLDDPHLSPDGRWIAFKATEAAGGVPSTIYVVAASGGDWVRITEGKYWDDRPRWSPDSKTIYFASSRTGFVNIWGRRFDPVKGQPMGESFPVTSFEDPAQMVFPEIDGLQFSLAAGCLVLPITEVTGSIWMLEEMDR